MPYIIPMIANNFKWYSHKYLSMDALLSIIMSGIIEAVKNKIHSAIVLFLLHHECVSITERITYTSSVLLLSPSRSQKFQNNGRSSRPQASTNIVNQSMHGTPYLSKSPTY